MDHHRILRVGNGGSIVIAIILLLGGCEYLRLLQFKRQLAEFDRHFRVERSANDVALTCLHPLLMPEDAALLFEGAPFQRVADEQGERWQYAFRKRYIRGHEEDGQFDFSQVLHFTEGRLRALQYTAGFLTVFEEPVLTAILRAVGRGTLAEEAERLTFRTTVPEGAALPTKAAFEAAWGQPYSAIVSGADERHLYVYTHDAPAPDSDAPVPILTIWLTFGPGDQQLKRLTVWYLGDSLELSVAQSVISGAFTL